MYKVTKLPIYFLFIRAVIDIHKLNAEHEFNISAKHKLTIPSINILGSVLVALSIPAFTKPFLPSSSAP
jgi:hypothetical protein